MRTLIFVNGISQLKKSLPLILEDAENELTAQSREWLNNLREEFVELNKKIENYNHKLKIICQKHIVCQNLSKIEGIGEMSATAIVASVGDPQHFKNGRQMAAWLGLVPKQHSSGEKQRLLGVSKRGDSYLRKLLIHGARSVVYRAKNKSDKRSQWINSLVERCGTNKASIALANKNARIICVLLKKGTIYQPTN